ncbi:hypothetical protein [Streptomyces anulatus]|uniref:hypothetical protein n=1 Tax=Streptomyces anulatus TaxID=1892 RepID=UPI0037DC4D1F|nr:hypothetical protein OHB50_39490 [Streptomyces anulatus]
MNYSHQPRRASAPWPYFLVGVALILVPALVVVVLLEAEERDSGTTPRDCPARHTTAGSYVPAGARPCVLRTGGHPGTGAAGTNDSSSRARDRKQPGRQAPAVKPPAAPAAKAPAAPAVKPPPVAVRK